MDYLKTIEAVAVLSARMSEAATCSERPRVLQFAEMCCDQLDQAASIATDQPFTTLMQERKAQLILQTLKNDAMTRQALNPELNSVELQWRCRKNSNPQS